MLALDAATLAVTVAQKLVDESEFVLDIAKGALEVVKFGFQTKKAVLDFAKDAVEIVRSVIKAALYVFSMIIKYGLKSLVDVKNCEFEAQVFLHDNSFYKISCDVMAFSTGWRTFMFEFDFKNPLTSMWKITKETVNVLIDVVSQLFGSRKRREVSYHAMTGLHKILHVYKRNVGPPFNESEFLSENFFNLTSNNTNYILENTYLNKVEYKSVQCLVPYIFIFT